MRLTTRQGCCPSSDQRFALPEAARRPSPTPRLALHLATFLLATGRQLQGRKVGCFQQSTLRRVVSHRGYLHARPHAHATGQLPSTAERPIHLVPLPYDPTALAAFSRSSDPSRMSRCSISVPFRYEPGRSFVSEYRPSKVLQLPATSAKPWLTPFESTKYPSTEPRS